MKSGWPFDLAQAFSVDRKGEPWLWGARPVAALTPGFGEAEGLDSRGRYASLRGGAGPLDASAGAIVLVLIQSSSLRSKVILVEDYRLP